jgi:hypothetical protein
MSTKPIQLGEEQSKKVYELALRFGTSAEELANRAVDEFCDSERPPLDAAQSRQSLDTWRRKLEAHLSALPHTQADHVDVSRESIY